MFPPVLSNIKVLDFSRLLPGPLASDLLVKMGAEVTCIIPPNEDPLGGGYTPFEKLKLGKKLLPLNLKDKNDFTKSQQLIEDSQIILEGFRPRTMERLGLGFEEVKKIQANILYVSLQGYEESHPKYFKGAHDLNFLVDSGVYMLLYPGGEKVMPTLQLADTFGGFYAAFQILMGRLEQLQNQFQAKHLKVSIVQGLQLLSDYLKDPSASPIISCLTGALARYQIYETQDGHRVVVGGIEEKFFRSLLKLLQVQVLPSESEEQIIKKLEGVFKTKKLKELKKILEEEDVCVSFVPMGPHPKKVSATL